MAGRQDLNYLGQGSMAESTKTLRRPYSRGEPVSCRAPLIKESAVTSKKPLDGSSGRCLAAQDGPEGLLHLDDERSA